VSARGRQQLRGDPFPPRPIDGAPDSPTPSSVVNATAPSPGVRLR
jgi:hypothetical protein